MTTAAPNQKIRKMVHANYITDCGVEFTLVRDMGTRLDTIEAFQRKDGKIVRALMTGVEVIESAEVPK